MREFCDRARAAVTSLEKEVASIIVRTPIKSANSESVNMVGEPIPLW